MLIKVGACAINNTDIWTRQGAYGSSLEDDATTGWQRKVFQFPRIQGVDIAGRIEAVGSDTPDTRIGQRVLVNPCIYGEQSDRRIAILIGSERDGGFAEYCTVPSDNAVHINSDYSDVELASFPCAYGTALSMLNKASVSANDTLIITGASGGVGSALIQLAKLRGVTIISIVSAGKEETAKELGSDYVINRTDNFESQLDCLGRVHRITVIADVVGGHMFPQLLDLLAFGGTYITSGAIAGPVVDLDLRTIYLNELTLFGATAFSHDEFLSLVAYIENEKIKPVIAKTYPLEEIHLAQKDFMDKKFFGKLVLIP
ncbi:MAG: zinc-binding dehydrogenase [Gammaproteobacteria bacterium]|nr:zinc-binding dehydrogenase [Gammaproteobacteria bacterium]